MLFHKPTKPPPPLRNALHLLLKTSPQKPIPRLNTLPLLPLQTTRPFTQTPNHPQKKAPPLPPRPAPPPESEIEESFVKGSGPGGQKINKTNSAVQLKHLPTGLVIKCQETRSRSQNRLIARRILAAKLDDMTRGEESRSAVVGEVRRRKKSSAAKKKRRKYRKLNEEKEKEREKGRMDGSGDIAFNAALLGSLGDGSGGRIRHDGGDGAGYSAGYNDENSDEHRDEDNDRDDDEDNDGDNDDNPFWDEDCGDIGGDSGGDGGLGGDIF